MLGQKNIFPKKCFIVYCEEAQKWKYHQSLQFYVSSIRLLVLLHVQSSPDIKTGALLDGFLEACSLD